MNLNDNDCGSVREAMERFLPNVSLETRVVPPTMVNHWRLVYLLS